jgi:NADPH-dependent 2,4-dienoyl-CoA reductase/sulfur reductase-like enzyme
MRYGGGITLLSDETVLPYNRPTLSKELLQWNHPVALAELEARSWYDKNGIEIRLGDPAIEVDAGLRTVRLASGTVLSYDQCLLATGARPRRPSVPGAEHILVLRTLADLMMLRERLGSRGAAVIIGGGFIGVEVAGSLAARGVRVTIVELTGALWGGLLGEELSNWAIGLLRERGVDIRLMTSVTSLDESAVILGSDRVSADVVLAGIGVVPNVELARVAGLTVEDGIVVNHRHETNAPGVFAAGDVANVAGRRVEHWHAAREGGARAASAMLGQAIPIHRAPWVFSRVGDSSLDVVGWADRWDETRRIGTSNGTDRGFAVAYAVDGVVTQLAIADHHLDIATARRFVEARPPVGALRRLSHL